jgi:hypothetical protein
MSPVPSNLNVPPRCGAALSVAELLETSALEKANAASPTIAITRIPR